MGFSITGYPNNTGFNHSFLNYDLMRMNVNLDFSQYANKDIAVLILCKTLILIIT